MDYPAIAEIMAKSGFDWLTVDKVGKQVELKAKVATISRRLTLREKDKKGSRYEN